MESPLPAVFHDKAKRTQQGNLLTLPLLYVMYRHLKVTVGKDPAIEVSVEIREDRSLQDLLALSTF